MTRGIGDNGGPTFDDIIQENREHGMLLTIKEAIVRAVRDPRLERRHLRVLAEVIDCINDETLSAFPGRAHLTDRANKYRDLERAYTEAGIAKTLSELTSYGYLVSTRRAAKEGGRALAHYTIKRTPKHELEEAITAFIMGTRAASPKKAWKADITYGGNVSADGEDVGNVTDGGNVRSRSGGDDTQQATTADADVTPESNVTGVGNVTSDVTPVVPTVTSRKELGESGRSAHANEVSAPIRPSLPPLPIYPPGNGGEEHKGHGVYLNGETIRHSAFAISLDGIRMGTMASGLPANEVIDKCLAHALQWAVEIENGMRPEKVLPTKIANFLSASIMGSVNQGKIHKVREARAAQPYAGHGGSTHGDGVAKSETKAGRLSRLIVEMPEDKP